MMESWHVVGQKVVCVNASSTIAPTDLVENRIYTVASVGIGSQDDPVFKLVELDCGRRLGFNASRFRPVYPKRTSIESLRSLLSPTPEQARQLEDA